MKVLETNLKDLFFLDKTVFYEKILQRLPVILKYKHKFLDVVGIVFCAPRGYVWKFHAETNKLFGDPLDGLRDADIEHGFKKEFGVVRKNSLLFGLSSIADSFEYSTFDVDVGAVLQTVQVKAAYENEVVEYLTEWWSEFENRSLLRAELGSVSVRLQEAESRWKTDDLSILLKDAWSVLMSNEDVKVYLERFHSKVVPALAGGGLILDEWMERFGAYPGRVTRSMLMPLKSNRRLEPIDPHKVKKFDIGLRDEFFSIQCAAVRVLQLPSMYYMVRDAYFDYQKSIAIHPIETITSFDWKTELEIYLTDMQNRYPILAYSRAVI